MPLFEKIKDLFIKRKTIFLVFFFAILFQFIFSFLFPSYDSTSSYWKDIKELGLYKDYSYGSFDSSMVAKIYPLISNYHINLDSAAHILLAHDFPKAYFRGIHTFLNRPLYAFLVFLVSKPLHLISDSYSFTFVAGLFLNFVLFFLTVSLFYLLIEKIISSRVAFFSSILLIFSSFVHVWLVQPSTQIFGLFEVILSLYLLYSYSAKPSFKKLIIFSLITGILMLGKMFFAIPFFILILAFFFKRYKEGALFIIAFFIPLILWYIIVTKVFGLNYYSGEMTDFNMYLINGWFLNIFKLPWTETFKIFLNALPSFFFSLVYGFLLLPVIFSLIGFGKLQFKEKNIFCFAFIFSFFTLFFIMNFYNPGHAFLLFPIIYPLTILGIDRTSNLLKKFNNFYYLAFYLLIYIFLIIISNINIFKIFKCDIGSPWLI